MSDQWIVRCSPTGMASAAPVVAINSMPAQTVTSFYWMLKTHRSNRVDGVSIPFSGGLYISRRLVYKYSQARYALKGIKSRPKDMRKLHLNRMNSDLPVPFISCRRIRDHRPAFDAGATSSQRRCKRSSCNSHHQLQLRRTPNDSNHGRRRHRRVLQKEPEEGKQASIVGDSGGDRCVHGGRQRLGFSFENSIKTRRCWKDRAQWPPCL